MTAICRQGAPSPRGWYPVEVGGMGHTRFKGLPGGFGFGADTAGGGDGERALRVSSMASVHGRQLDLSIVVSP